MPPGGPVELDPYVHRRRLSAALRRARTRAGLTQPEAAATLDWSVSKLVRIESGSVRVSLTDLAALLALFGVDDGWAEDMRADGRAARGRPWWADFKGVFSDAYLGYLSYEASATEISQFQSQLVPGLLQTETTARAVLTTVREPAEVDRMVAARLRRQRLLDRSDGPLATFLLDEAVLRRPIGGPAAMRGQLEHLKAMARRPNITIRVVPFDAGEHPGIAGSFIILGLPDQTVIYAEGSSAGMVRGDPGTVADYRGRLRGVLAKAGPEERFQALVDDALDRLPGAAAVTESASIADE